MKFIADLHIHSRFSMATARNLDFEHLYMAAQLKGITVVGTGDFTHPGWYEEISEKLVPAEPGLFRLNDEAARIADEQVPASCRRPVRFMLSVEISNIYKKNSRTRKNHNLVFFPDLETAGVFNKRLDAIGNITADGRPILGLDAKHLLEISLEASDQSFFIPAHVWTPWFSLLGSKSGFDSLEECFEDLTPHIFAVETGLSSDPAMNWQVSGLDGLTLVSNSDAHSPMKLGREANLLDTELSYNGIRSAIKTGDPDRFLGTFEFYPEEGKYHLDGHRKCNICLHPRETHALDGKCPVCGKPLTCGVLYRVAALSDRPEGARPDTTHPFVSMVPLTDILSEIFQVGPNTKKVKKNYDTILTKLGSEFDVLNELPVESLESSGVPLLAEAIHRVRSNQLELIPGYDGEYGRIRIFKNQERQRLMGQQAMFSMPVASPTPAPRRRKNINGENKNLPTVKMPDKKSGESPVSLIRENEPPAILSGLNEDQHRAVTHSAGPLLISAGPGTGKTRTLTHRIAYLIKEKGVSPERILAVTFTAKAAREMKTRLENLLDSSKDLPRVSTFHAFCLTELLAAPDCPADGVINDADRDLFLAQARQATMTDKAGELSVADLREAVIGAKQRMESPGACRQQDQFDHPSDPVDPAVSRAYAAYQDLLAVERRFDYEDLIFNMVTRLERDEGYRNALAARFQYIFVDEYQDLNYGQYRLIKALAPPDTDLCVIGDPDQSIYGFRGSDVQYFARFLEDYPTATLIQLTRNYRSAQTILDAAFQVIKDYQLPMADSGGISARIYSGMDGMKRIGIMEMNSARGEAEALAGLIENLVGGSGYHRVDTGRVADANISGALSFSDFAILYRTDRQHVDIAEALDRRGIPFQVASRDRAYGQKEVRGLMSLLKVVTRTGTYADFDRTVGVVRPAPGKETVHRFKAWGMEQSYDCNAAREKARQLPIPGMDPRGRQNLAEFLAKLATLEKKVAPMPVADKLRYLISHTGVGKAAEASALVKEVFDQVIAHAETAAGNTLDFFSGLALQTDTDIYVSHAEKVALMTIHAAKGLEFPVVMVAGCEEDYLPFRRHADEAVDLDEERRLFYVAMTRAENQLYLSRAKNRVIYGKKVSRSMSPFVGDIESRLLGQAMPSTKKKKLGPTQLKLF